MPFRADLSRRRRKILEEELRRIAASLEGFPGVKRALLFGSLARDEVRPQSDLDLLLVVEEDDLPSPRRWDFYYLRLKPRNLDLLVYTPRELEEVKERPFFRRALREAIVIYERKDS